MIYPIERGHYHDFSVLERGKLPPRAYGIPFSTRARADAAGLLDRRYRSDKVQCLSGVWDFCFYPRPADLPQAFDTAAASFRPIEVPGCWQFQGYDKPFYVNTRYQFPFDPPHIPQDEPVGEVGFWGGIDTDPGWHTVRPKDQYNFVGVYRKRLTLQRVASRMILSFLGVASCLDLYCNGVFVGYSEGSHNVAEFDLAPLLQVGENELLVVVRRWCSGIMSVAERWLPALLASRACPLRRWDMALFLCAPFAQALSPLPAVLWGVWAWQQGALGTCFAVGAAGLLAGYGTLAVLAAVLARRAGGCAAGTVWLFPLFMASWLPLQAVSLLHRSRVWRPIPHGRPMSARETVQV